MTYIFPSLTIDETNYLIENYPTQGSTQCSIVLNRSKKQINHKASRLKLRVLPETRSRIQTINSSKGGKINCNVKADQFIIPNKITSYLLGLFWADIHLMNTKKNPYRIALEIKSSDFIEIEPFVDLTGKWCKTHRKREGKKPQSTAITNTKILYQFLESKNYTTDNVAPKLEFIPDNLKPYWFRGLFDGDGCFYFHKNNT